MANIQNLQDAAIVEIMDVLTASKFISWNEYNQIVDKHLDEVINPDYNDSKTFIRNVVYSMTIQASNGIGF